MIDLNWRTLGAVHFNELGFNNIRLYPSLVAEISHHPCGFSCIGWFVATEERDVTWKSRERQVVSVGSTGCLGLLVICSFLHRLIDRQQEQEW